jgi:hypothetical protein
MTIYVGLDKVDPERLEAQYVLTEALWSTLVKQGVRKGSVGRIEAFFFGDDESAAKSLATSFAPSGGWRHEVVCGDVAPERVCVKVVSPEVRLSPEAFRGLVEVTMIAAQAHAFRFDGFQVNVGAVRRRPWWRFW